VFFLGLGHMEAFLYPTAVHLIFGDFLYQGSYIVSKSLDWMRRLKISAVVNASVEVECLFEDELEYFRIPVDDHPDDAESLFTHLEAATAFIGEWFTQTLHS
jgi:hypothetical protein